MQSATHPRPETFDNRTDLLVPAVRFPKMNKNCSVEEYEHEMECGFNTSPAFIARTLTLTNAEYDEFADNLMGDRDWFNDTGGNNTTTDPRPDLDNFLQLNEAERDIWLAGSFAICCLVLSEGRRTLYIDCQGYSYARYVGWE